jgi:hypothetical protein
MKRQLLILIFLITLVVSSGCKKNDSPGNSGIETIDNTLYGTGAYYANGFSFSLAKKVPTSDNPPPDITFDNDVTLLIQILQTNNYKESFYKVGEYANTSLAEQAFINLTTLSVTQWVVWGYQIKPNQVWIFRTANEHYAKIRIISTVSETRDNRSFASCTFQWTYQPDGSLTFPAR